MKNKNIPDAIRFAPLHVAWMVDPQEGGSWCVMTRRDETPGSLNNFTVAECQHQADAVLFAAAPALLAALKAFVKQYQGNGHDEREQRPEMKLARAAIAQAEGN